MKPATKNRTNGFASICVHSGVTDWLEALGRHFEFTEQFIITKVPTKITIKHKTMMKCEVDVHKNQLQSRIDGWHITVEILKYTRDSLSNYC